MIINLAAILATLDPNTGFRLANQARVPANYLWNLFLPEIPRGDYQAKSGTMTVRTTMAGMVGMDSPYPEGGFVELSTFSEETTKIANRVRLSEKAQRDLQQFLSEIALASGDVSRAATLEALNFYDKLVVQAHLDTFEYLRSRAIQGTIDWTFNKKRLLVDYGIPTANKGPQRTGNDHYGGSASKFWTDISFLRKRLKYNVRALVAHDDTIDLARNNPVNSMAVISEDNGSITFKKVNTYGDWTKDASDTVTLIKYGMEGEIYDEVNPGLLKQIKMMPTGVITGLGNNSGTRFVVGAGSTPPPENALGYTHIGPTVEGGGARGRWGDVRVPEGEPWAFEGRGVTNGLPVIEAPDKIAHVYTDMS